MKNGKILFAVEYVLQKGTWDWEQEGLEQEDFHTVLRAAGETETTQENIQDWLELGDVDRGFQLLTEEEIATVIFLLFIFISTTCIIKFSIYLFPKFFFCLLGLYFALLIRIIV
jgi:hypothetical protein